MSDQEPQILLCIQCGMQALVSGVPDPPIAETVEQHMARRHPDPVACRAEREDLEMKLVLQRHPDDATRH